MGVFISNSYSRIEASHLRDENKRLKDENAKLRELVVDMLWTMKHAHGWFKSDTHEMLMTDVRGRDGKPTNVSRSLVIDEGIYEQRMRELRIEVPE